MPDPSKVSKQAAPEPQTGVRCADCGTIFRTPTGFCVNCLFQNALDPGGDDAAEDTLEALFDQADLLAGAEGLENYEILEEIGRGGMGVIFRARQRHSGRVVVIKRLLSDFGDSPATVARFRREAQAAASLDHPNILPIYEVGDDKSGQPFFSMKYAPGGSLLQAQTTRRYTARESARLVEIVARAVRYAHGRGILHRDLKPGNILLDERGTPLISDFGLAKWLDGSGDLTRTMTTLGTPGYLAPEQARGPSSRLAPSADVYSLGAILFELLTGRPPFSGEHALAVIQQATEVEAPKVRSLAPGVDRDLETICARCLEREPPARYRSAADLADDLERWLDGRQILARPLSPAGRLWRWSRRNRALAISSAACVLLGGVAIVRYLENRQLAGVVLDDAMATHSVAVAPFLDLDRVMEDGAGTSRVAIALREELNHIGSSRVIPAVSDPAGVTGNAERFRAIAHRCKARYVLFATHRKVNNKTRFSVQMMDGNGEAVLRRIVLVDADEGGAEQIAKRLASAVYSVLDSTNEAVLVSAQLDPGMRDGPARDLILAGHELLNHLTAVDIDRALECFQKAVKAEPSSALALASVASAAAMKFHFQSDAQLLALAEQSARRALTLDAGSAPAHGALAAVLFQKGNFRNALEEATSAIEFGGVEDTFATIIGLNLKMLGRPSDALAWFEIMARSQARPGKQIFITGDCWSDLCADEQAEAIYHQVSDLRPDLPEGWLGVCRLRLLEKNLAAARDIYIQNQGQYKAFAYPAEMEAQIEFFARNFSTARLLYENLMKGDPAGGGSFYGGVSFQSALGRLLVATGEKDKGTQLLTRALEQENALLASAPSHPETLYRVAALEASLDKPASAVEHFRAAAAAGWIDYRSAALDPRFDGIAADARFKEILAGLNAKVETLRRQAIDREQNPKPTNNGG